MDYEEAKELIVAGLQKKQKVKSKFISMTWPRLSAKSPERLKNMSIKWLWKAYLNIGPAAALRFMDCPEPANKLARKREINLPFSESELF